MQTKDKLEEAFSEFLETKEYDKANEAIFALVRAAFLAGWHAALSKAPSNQ